MISWRRPYKKRCRNILEPCQPILLNFARIFTTFEGECFSYQPTSKYTPPIKFVNTAPKNGDLNAVLPVVA